MSTPPLVYAFDHRHRRPPMDLADLLGGKGANLGEMASVLGLPVPPGFTITTDACRSYLRSGWPAKLDEQLDRHLARLEKRSGRSFGDPDDPLLVSVRSGARFSIPGMMDTILNLGLNDRSVRGLARITGDAAFTYGSYARLISMYGRVVLGIDAAIFEDRQVAAMETEGVSDAAELPPAAGSSCARVTRPRSRRPRAGRFRSSLPRSCEAPWRRCSPRGTPIAPSPIEPRSTSPTTWERP